MSRKNIHTVVEQLLEPYLEKKSFELVDIEFVREGKNRFLRIYVDKPGGIDIDDCGQVSEYLSQRLDEEDPIQEAYFLEVSSPGAERPLKKTKDFYWAVGKHVHVTTYAPVHGQKEFEGKLLSYDEEYLVIEEAGKSHDIATDQVAKARLAIVF